EETRRRDHQGAGERDRSDARLAEEERTVSPRSAGLRIWSRRIFQRAPWQSVAVIAQPLDPTQRALRDWDNIVATRDPMGRSRDPARNGPCSRRECTVAPYRATALERSARAPSR